MTDEQRRRPAVSVVVPILNAGPSVDAFHKAAGPALRQIDPRCEIILVDDGSTDDTWERIKAIAANDDAVIGASLARNVGQAGALCAGFSLAQGGVVMMMDDDLECAPEELHRFVDAVMSGSDFASGWRQGHRAFLRSLGSRMYNRRVSRWGYSIHDAGCGVNAMTVDIAHRVARQGWSARQHRIKLVAEDLADVVVEIPFQLQPTSESRYGVRKLAASWLDSEIVFGPLSPHKVALFGVATPVVVGALLVALATCSQKRRRSRFLFLALATALFAGATAVGDLFLLWRRVERRSVNEPAFEIAAVVGADGKSREVHG